MRFLRSKLLQCLAILAAALVFHGWYARDGLALFDVGLLTDGALRTLRGEWFAADFYAPYGPLRYWILAAWFGVFGASVASWCNLAVLLQALADVALFLLAARRGPRDVAWLVALMLALAHGALHKSFLLWSVILVMVAASFLEERPSVRRCLAGGALAGTVFLLRYDLGVFGLAALAAQVLWLPSARGQRLLGLGAGFTAVVGAVALVLLGVGADFVDWWNHTWQRIAVQERISIDFPAPWQDASFRYGRWALFLALVGLPVVYLAWLGGVVLRRVRRRPEEGDGFRLAVAALGLLLLNQARLVPSTNRCFQALPPAYLAVADGAGRRGRLSGRLCVYACVAALWLWVALGTHDVYHGSYTAHLRDGVVVQGPTAGMRLPPEEAAPLEAAMARLRELVPPGEKLAQGPGCALFGLLVERDLAIPYAEPSYYYRSEEYQRRAIAAWEESRAPAFVHDVRPAATFVFPREAPLLFEYLQQHYVPDSVFGPYEILRRRGE